MTNKRRRSSGGNTSSGGNEAHCHEQRPHGDLATRRKERGALNVLATCVKPYLGGLGRERIKELQLILRNPDPLPSTPADIAADRQRREVAMAEINEAISKLPPPRERRGSPLKGDKEDWEKKYILDDLRDNAPKILITRELTRGPRILPERRQNPNFLCLPLKYKKPYYTPATLLESMRIVEEDGKWKREGLKEPPEYRKRRVVRKPSGAGRMELD